MTLGGAPEALTLGYLRNQRLVKSLDDIESVQVDWEVEAAAVKTRNGIADVEERTAKRVVTTGCGQGSVFGGLMDEVDTHRAAARRAPARSPRCTASSTPSAPSSRSTSRPARCTAARCSPSEASCCISSRTSAATTRSTPSPAGCGWTGWAAPTRCSTRPAG